MFGKKYDNPEINKLIDEENKKKQANKTKPIIKGAARPQCLAPTRDMPIAKGSSNAKPTQFLANKKDKK